MMEMEDQSTVTLMVHISGQLSSIKEEQRIINERLQRLEDIILGYGHQTGDGASVSDKTVLTTTKAGLQENPKLARLTVRLPPVEERNRPLKRYDYYTTTYQHFFSPRDGQGNILTF